MVRSGADLAGGKAVAHDDQRLADGEGFVCICNQRDHRIRASRRDCLLQAGIVDIRLVHLQPGYAFVFQRLLRRLVVIIADPEGVNRILCNQAAVLRCDILADVAGEFAAADELLVCDIRGAILQIAGYRLVVLAADFTALDLSCRRAARIIAGVEHDGVARADITVRVMGIIFFRAGAGHLAAVHLQRARFHIDAAVAADLAAVDDQRAILRVIDAGGAQCRIGDDLRALLNGDDRIMTIPAAIAHDRGIRRAGGIDRAGHGQFTARLLLQQDRVARHLDVFPDA